MDCIVIVPLNKTIRKRLVEAFVFSLLEGDESYNMFWEEIRLINMVYEISHVNLQYYLNSTHFTTDLANEMPNGVSFQMSAVLCEAISLN